MTDKLHLEQLYLAIHNQYESIAYDLPERHQKSCLRLLNVATQLYNNAQRLLRKQSSLIKVDNDPLSLQQNLLLIQQLYDICNYGDSIANALLAVKNFLHNLNISPNLLTLTDVKFDEK